MSARSAEDRIRELARDLAPVRPIPRLRAVLAAALALGLLAAVSHWLLGGPGLRPGGAVVSGPPYLATLAGLVALALGALGGALAASVPGREAAARLGDRVALAALGLAVAGGLWGAVAGGAAGREIDGLLFCIGRSLALGAGPGLLALGFVAYAAVRPPRPAAVLALVGGAALGGAAVHATCPSDASLHWLLAHTLVPLAGAAVLAAPLGAAVGRARRG